MSQGIYSKSFLIVTENKNIYFKNKIFCALNYNMYKEKKDIAKKLIKNNMDIDELK